MACARAGILYLHRSVRQQKNGTSIWSQINITFENIKYDKLLRKMGSYITSAGVSFFIPRTIVYTHPARANRAMTLFASLGPSADCRGLTEVPTYQVRIGHTRANSANTSFPPGTCRRDAAMRRHLPYQVSCRFPFTLLALALCGENSLQNPLFSLQGWTILPGLTGVGNCYRVPLVTIGARRNP